MMMMMMMMQEQGFDVSAVAIKTPFCDFDCGRGCGFEIRERADDLDVNLKTVYLGDENWHCLTVSRRDPKTGKFTLEKMPVYHIVDEKEKKQAS